MFKQPWSAYPIQNNKPYGFSYHQESIFDSKTNRIFYFGGTLNDGLDSTDPDISFASSITFDFAKGEWGSQLLNGQGPTPRFGHTATLCKRLYLILVFTTHVNDSLFKKFKITVENDQRYVLIYGGQSLGSTTKG